MSSQRLLKFKVPVARISNILRKREFEEEFDPGENPRNAQQCA